MISPDINIDLDINEIRKFMDKMHNESLVRYNTSDVNENNHR